MIIVRGVVKGSPETIEALKAVALEHVRRSRTEPGCISHEVALDAENPCTLVFFERWADAAALQAHFQVPESIEMVRSLKRLGATTEEMVIYEAEKTRV